MIAAILAMSTLGCDGAEREPSPTPDATLLASAEPMINPDAAFSVTFRLRGRLSTEETLIWRQRAGTRRLDLLDAGTDTTQGSFSVFAGFTTEGIERSLDCWWSTVRRARGEVNLTCVPGGTSGPVDGDIDWAATGRPAAQLQTRTILAREARCYAVRTLYTAEICVDAGGLPLFLDSVGPERSRISMTAVAIGDVADLVTPEAIGLAPEDIIADIATLDLPPGVRPVWEEAP